MLSTTMLTTSRGRRMEATTQAEAAYRQIREKIITLELPPASLVDEARLVANLGLGHTPIREALRRLALESLVVILPRRGTIVADLNWSDLQKIFELRLELETYAARLAAERATPAQIAAMLALFADHEALLANGDNQELMRIDHEAHQLLHAAAQNEFLAETLERLYNHIHRLWYVSLHKVRRLREAISEHRDIAAAIQQGDGERAAALMREHIIGFQEQFLASR